MSIKTLIRSAVVAAVAVTLSVPAMAGQVGSGSRNEFGSGSNYSTKVQDVIGGLRSTTLTVNSIMNIDSHNSSSKHWAEVTADKFEAKIGTESSGYRIPCTNIYTEKFSASAYANGTLLVSTGQNQSSTEVKGVETVHMNQTESLILGRGQETSGAQEAYRYHDSNSYSFF